MEKNVSAIRRNLSPADERTVSLLDYSMTESEKVEVEQLRLECGRSAKVSY